MTELIWEGKYKDGKKVAPVRIALPFQTIETVNESSQQRQKTLDFFTNSVLQGGDNKEWRNRLIWGDKKYVLPSLLPEFAGKVNLIYIDPPFNVGSDFSFTATIAPAQAGQADHPDTDEDDASTGSASFVKQPSIIEQKAYRDTWGKGLDSYMQWFYETALLLRELLAEDGSIYVHLDWRMIHYCKVVMDEVYGYENFKNQIIWKRGKMKGAKAVGLQFGRNHDTILYYSKGNKCTYNRQHIPYEEEYVKQRYTKDDNDGRGPYTDQPIGTRSTESLKQLRAEGRIFKTTGGTERIKFYLSEMPGIAMDDVWTDIDEINSMAKDNVGYGTQKPNLLLKRIMQASSNEGDLVLDCFCGSGTTAATAEKLNRRWITCDLGRFAIHTARKRFLGIDNVKPFIVQNLGKYERQQWMKAELSNSALQGGEKAQSGATENRMQQEKTYKHFINELYHAKPLDGYTWIHGAKAGRMIHVGSVETPVTVDDIKATILEFWKLAGKDINAALQGGDAESPGKDTNAALQGGDAESPGKDTNAALQGGDAESPGKDTNAAHQGGDAQSPGKDTNAALQGGDAQSPGKDTNTALQGGDAQSSKSKKGFSPDSYGIKLGIDFLGWDFAFDVNETAAQFAASNKVDVKFKKIPREVLEKKAVEQGDIKFYELASLKIKTKVDKKKLNITLDNFIIPPDDIPDEVRAHITHWSQWIDYWAVDWNYRDDTFHNEWQSYCTKQNPKIELTATNLYEAKGKFTVLVKVIDILGNDTTKAVEVEIK